MNDWSFIPGQPKRCIHCAHCVCDVLIEDEQHTLCDLPKCIHEVKQ